MGRPPSRARIILFAAAGVALTIAALSNALGNALAISAPTVAAGQMGANPAVGLTTINLSALASGTAGQLDQAQSLATQSLKRQAINPAALVVLATVADVRRRPEAANLFMAADKLSRRQPLSEAWLLEYYVAAGSVPKALRQYDILLRLQPEFSNAAFPVLAAALAEPAVQQNLAPYFDRPSPWLADFTAFAAIKSGAPESLATMLINNHRTRAAVAIGLPLSDLFKKLVSTGHARFIPPLFRDAGRWSPKMLDQVALDGNATDPVANPVTWWLAQNDGADVQILTVDNTPAIKVDITGLSPTQHSVEKLFFLARKPSSLQFVSDVERDGGGSAEWQVVCLGAQPPSVLARSGNLLKRPGPVALNFDVAPNCDAVELVLETVGGSEDQGSSISFRKMALR